jgi:hypothetical protein
MSFASIATPFINLGISVFPLSPGTKIPPAGLKFLEAATTNAQTIARWNAENPNYNVALLANEEYCFLEFDIAHGFSKATKSMGQQEVPQTRSQMSGKGFGHYIFKHTEKSRAMGNRSANLHEPCTCNSQQNRTCTQQFCQAGGPHHHHEWFSFRADNKYLVGAGSLHPNGKRYQTARDIDPIPVPDWVLAFVDRETRSIATRTKPNVKNMVRVSEDFDFDDLMDFFNITIDHVKDGCWHVVAECPGTDCPHEHSTLTAFYWDGVNLGWSCFAQGCPTCGMRIGELIKFLNDKKGEPYRGLIWDNEDSQPDLTDTRFNVEVDEVGPLDATEPVDNHIVSAAELAQIMGAVDITDKVPMTVLPGDPAKRMVATPVIVEKPTPTVEDYETSFYEAIEATNPIVLDFPRIEPKNDGMFPFPVDAMYGKLKDMALELNAPYGFGYPSLLTTACGLPIEDAAGNTRATLYTANLGGFNYGKSIVTERAMASFGVDEGVYEDGTPSSDRGLINMVGEDVAKRTVFVQDEFRTLLSKCAILNSSLTPVLCTLWSKDHAKASDKRATDECWGVVSILGNLAVEDGGDFAKVMGAETTKGLYDRMLFGIGPVVDYYPCTVNKQYIKVKPCLVPGWCYTKMHKWSGEDRGKRRLGEIGLRVALIQSSINGDKEVTKESFECAMKLMDWQYSIRLVYSAGKAESKEAEAFEAVVGALQAQLDKQRKTGTPHKSAREDKEMEELIPDYRCRQLHWSQIMNGKSLYRKYGSGMLNRTKQTMVQENLLAIIYDKDEKGESSREASPFVMLRGKIY